ncbi:MAG: glycosyltransferase family 25 protein, partial [Pseudomonadota bacterium]
MTRTIKLPDFISKVIVIHLNRATDRKPHLEKLAELFANYDFEVFPAVDARELTEHEKGERYIRNLFDPRYPFPLSDTEIACFFSHRTVWEVIRSEVNGATLVLEDDVDFETAKFSNAIAALTEGSIKETYIRLPCKKPATLPKTASAELRTPKEVGLG